MPAFIIIELNLYTSSEKRLLFLNHIPNRSGSTSKPEPSGKCLKRLLVFINKSGIQQSDPGSANFAFIKNYLGQ